MAIVPYKLAIASALSVSVIWITCILLVSIFPGMMSSMTSLMFHIDMGSIDWQITSVGAIVGLIVWALTAGLAGWLLGYAYNKL
ncbi:MAG: hypothetical protein JKY29_14075 [Gammaproteobacteria bacterium]|nr:hypothetical protein [Gammaproteobacteria bacterium]